jgi:hypothetical protein
MLKASISLFALALAIPAANAQLGGVTGGATGA